MSINPFKPQKGGVPASVRNVPPKISTGKTRINVSLSPELVKAALDKYPTAPSLAKAVEWWLTDLQTSES